MPNDKENIKKWLKRYDKITIRENSGVKIANELGVPAEQVLDPTFLLEKSEWEKLIPQRECSEKYVLVYQLHPNKQFDEYAKQYAKKKGLKLYRLSHCFHHIVRSGKFVCCPPIGEFLWYIKMPSISLPILSMALPLQSVLTHNLPMFCQRVTAKEFQVFFSLSATKTEYSKATTTLTLTAKK